MNSACKISVAIAWLTVISAVDPSHAAGTLSTFSAAITPFIANAIDQLPVHSVNEITPHVEALASIAKNNEMYDFFQKVAEECHKYGNKLADKERSTALLERNKEATIEDNRKEGGENVSDSNKKLLNESVDVSNRKSEASEKEDAASKKEDSEDGRNNDKSNSEGSSSDDEAASGPNKMPNAKKPLRLKDLAEGKTRILRKNNVEITLTRRGNKVEVETRRPGKSSQPWDKVDVNGKDGELTLKKYVDKLAAAPEKI